MTSLVDSRWSSEVMKEGDKEEGKGGVGRRVREGGEGGKGGVGRRAREGWGGG